MDLVTLADLERLYPAPNATALAKALDHVDDEAARFIALSTFCILASAGPDGAMDVSPRGGPAGFVLAEGSRRLILPDRPGNNRIDSLRNLAGRRSGVALLFVIPGVDETLRISGQATISIDPDLLERLGPKGQPPRSALLVEVEECFLHCSKGLMRGELWNAEVQSLGSERWRQGRLAALGRN